MQASPSSVKSAPSISQALAQVGCGPKVVQAVVKGDVAMVDQIASMQAPLPTSAPVKRAGPR